VPDGLGPDGNVPVGSEFDYGINVLQIVPPAGPLHGCGEAVIIGSGFVDSDTLTAKIGLIDVPATYLSPNSVLVTLPSMDRVGATGKREVAVRVGNSGSKASLSFALYTFTSEPIVPVARASTSPRRSAYGVRAR
jgi:hypothetical protein